VSVFVSVYTMTNNGNDVIAPTAQAAMPAITFPSFPCSEVDLHSHLTEIMDSFNLCHSGER